MGQAVAFGEEVWAGHGEHRFMQARRQIRRLVDPFGEGGSGRHGGLPLRMVVPRRIGAILIEAEAFSGTLVLHCKDTKKS